MVSGNRCRCDPDRRSAIVCRRRIVSCRCCTRRSGSVHSYPAAGVALGISAYHCRGAGSGLRLVSYLDGRGLLRDPAARTFRRTRDSASRSCAGAPAVTALLSPFQGSLIFCFRPMACAMGFVLAPLPGLVTGERRRAWIFQVFSVPLCLCGELFFRIARAKRNARDSVKSWAFVEQPLPRKAVLADSFGDSVALDTCF